MIGTNRSLHPPGTNGYTAAIPTPAVIEPEPVETPPSRWNRLRASISKSATMVVGLLVSIALLVGVYLYTQLGNEQSNLRGEISTLRTEVFKIRQRLVRKDDLNARTLAAHAMLKEVGSATTAAKEGWADRLSEQKTVLHDLQNLGIDVKRELARLQSRIAVQEEARGVTGSTSGNGGPANRPE